MSFGLQLQAVNVFNHTMFQDIPPQLGETGFDLSFPQNFGKITTQYNTPRFLNIGIRVDF